MGVKYILSQVGAKMGLNPSVEGDRLVMLRFLNEAADELYAQSDMFDSNVEQCFKVNGDQTVAFPHTVGHIRAVREFNSQIPWNINQMRPRYNVSNWQDMWRNYRLKGISATERALVNEGLLTITCEAIESTPITVTITGSTTSATQISEVVTLDATEKETVNAFVSIDAIVKSATTQHDIVILDMDGNLISEIANNRLSAEFHIIDVSALPWLNQNQANQDHYVEILYKKPLSYLSADGDEFPAKGYDNVLVNKVLQLWCEEQGKADEALLYDQKATRSLARKHEDANRATQDKVAMVPNPHDSLCARVRYGDKWRFRGYTYILGPR